MLNVTFIDRAYTPEDNIRTYVEWHRGFEKVYNIGLDSARNLSNEIWLYAEAHLRVRHFRHYSWIKLKPLLKGWLFMDGDTEEVFPLKYYISGVKQRYHNKQPYAECEVYFER